MGDPSWMTLLEYKSLMFEMMPFLIDRRSFVSGNPERKPFLEIPSRQPPLAAIKDTHWNPIVASTLGVVFTNGALSLHVLNQACTDVSSSIFFLASPINLRLKEMLRGSSWFLVLN